MLDFPALGDGGKCLPRWRLSTAASRITCISMITLLLKALLASALGIAILYAL
jgi:hypothetical protein